MSTTKPKRLSSGILQADSAAVFSDERLQKINAILPKFKGPARVADQPAEPSVVLDPQLRQEDDVATAEGDLFKAVPVDKLFTADVNPRQIINEQRIVDLALSLVKDGQLQPLLVTPHPEILDAYVIVEGHTRRLAALKIGLTHLQCIVRSIPSSKARYIAARTSNSARTELYPIDDGLAWADLVDKGVFSSFGEINEALGLGLSPTALSRYKAFSDLPSECIQLMQQAPDKFTAHVAADVRVAVDRLGLRATLGLVQQVAQGGLPPKQLLRRLQANKPVNTTGVRQASIWPVLLDGRPVARIRRVDASRLTLDIPAGVPDGLEAKLARVLNDLLVTETPPAVD